MPTYVYRREDGSTFEVQQRITEPPLERCPDTGQAVSRIISGSAGLIFKGSGFYLTDYARSNKGGNGSDTSGSKEKTASDAGKPDATKSENSTSTKSKETGS